MERRGQRLRGLHPVTTTADVVIIGAGIIGAAIAHECARHGIGRVVVVDAAPGPGEGSTGASSSICRTRYSDPRVVQLAVDGVAAYRHWSDYLDSDHLAARFVETGAVWIADRSMDDVGGEVDTLQAAGADASALSADDLDHRFPQVSPCVTTWADDAADHDCRSAEAYLFEHRAGYVDPSAALTDLLTVSRRMEVDVRFGTRVIDVMRSAAGVTGVVLASGDRIAASVVVNAAGPWCNEINRLARLELRWTFTPTRIQTLHHPWPADQLPITIDVSTGLYARPDRNSDTIWAGSVREEDERETVDPDDYLRTLNQAFRDRLLVGLQHRFPGIRATGRVPGIAGLYTINRQDVHPVVGPSGVDGFWLANGFSGHGFKLAPAIGSMVSQGLGGSRMAHDTEVGLDLLSVDRAPIGVDSKNVLA